MRSTDSGVPVAAAAVIVTDVRGDALANDRTDAFGEFAVADLVPGTVTRGPLPQHRPLAQPVDIGTAGTHLEAELHPGACLRRTVSGGAVPLSHARATLVGSVGNAVATTTTGSDGT